MTTADTQPQLFTPPAPAVVAAPPPIADPPTGPLPTSETSDQTLSIPDLLEQVFLSQSHFRRWDRELLFGASDKELGRAFGNAWFSGRSGYDLEFKSEGEPTLRVRHRLFNVEVATQTEGEIAAYVRRFTGIPQPKPIASQITLLAAFLDEERKRQRADILLYIRSRFGEKTPRHKKNQPPVTHTSEKIAALLFEDDCLTDRSDRRLLLTITRLLIDEKNLRTLKAAEHAIKIVDVARGRWRSMLSYWTDVNALRDDDVDHYLPGPAASPP